VKHVELFCSVTIDVQEDNLFTSWMVRKELLKVIVSFWEQSKKESRTLVTSKTFPSIVTQQLSLVSYSVTSLAVYSPGDPAVAAFFSFFMAQISSSLALASGL
jgi:hypothetical protein